MQTDNKFFDDLAKLGQSAAGTLHGVKGEAQAMIRARLEDMIKDMDLVSREEFDVLRDMVTEARAQNSQLEQKITALEKTIKKKVIMEKELLAPKKQKTNKRPKK